MLGSEIRELVIVKLEEHTPFGDKSGETLLAGGDILSEVKPVYSYIDATLAEAANEALTILPIERLTPIAMDPVHGNHVVAMPDLDDDRIGTIEKPSGYLRLHTLQMGGWSRPTHEVVRPSNQLYIQQFDIYARGNAQKPIVTDDGKYLHYYSQPVSAIAGEIKTFLYVPEFELNIDYPKEVAEVIALFTAGKIYEIFSQKEQMEIMAKEIESVISTMKL